MAQTGKTILEIQGLSKNFGGIRAVDDLSFDVKRGEILGLLGPNGSGKTTLFNLITGVYEADSGAIRFQGHDITNKLSYKIALKGISRTFQSTKLFPNQTVADNIAIAMIARARTRHIAETRQKAGDVLLFTHLENVKDSMQAISPMFSRGVSWWPWRSSRTPTFCSSTR